MDEPVIHSHLTDELDDSHPLACTMVYCDMAREHNCNGLLHASNNECMTTWVEFAGKHVCAEAFAMYILERSDGALVEREFLEFIGSAIERPLPSGPMDTPVWPISTAIAETGPKTRIWRSYDELMRDNAMKESWYDNIETGIREVVKLLRNNNFHTTYSCHHAMVIEMEFYKVAEIQQLYDILISNGYDGFTIELRFFKECGLNLRQLCKLQFHKCPVCGAG